MGVVHHNHGRDVVRDGAVRQSRRNRPNSARGSTPGGEWLLYLHNSDAAAAAAVVDCHSSGGVVVVVVSWPPLRWIAVVVVVAAVVATSSNVNTTRS